MPGSLPLPYDDREPVYRLRDEKGRAAQELFGAIPGGDEELVALARARSPDPSRREALLDALLPRWDALPLPAASRESLSLLERLETRIVLAGQQPALAGCPLLLFAKALSAARLARRLREAGLAAVPVFWIADEDHDVEELHPGVFPRSGAPPFEIAIPFEEGRTPIADLRLGDGEAPIVAALREALPATAARGWALEALERSAHPSPSEWFQGFLLQALQGEGILPVHPAWLRRMQEPIIRGELSSPGSLAADARAAIPALEALGLAPPIPRPAELPFFMIGEDGGRNRLEPVPGGARMAGGEERRLAHRELEQLLREEPERFSPDALLRPLVQDALLEPLAVILGPTEMAYHLELAGAYPARGIPRPLLMPRLRVRVLDRLLARRLRDRGIDPREAATRDDPALRLSSPVAEKLAAEVEEGGGALLRLVESLAEREETAGPLRKRAARLGRRWRADLQKLKGSILRWVDGGVEEERRHLAAAHAVLWPGGHDGEREVSVLHYLSRFGPQFLDRLGAEYDPFDSRARLLILEPLEEAGESR